MIYKSWKLKENQKLNKHSFPKWISGDIEPENNGYYITIMIDDAGELYSLFQEYENKKWEYIQEFEDKNIEYDPAYNYPDPMIAWSVVPNVHYFSKEESWQDIASE